MDKGNCCLVIADHCIHCVYDINVCAYVKHVMKDSNLNLSRYHRQILLTEVGQTGQKLLAESHAMVIGCGALGCVVSDLLVRAGVGQITIIDRDLVEITNLQRQTLFNEADANNHSPKAEAAQQHLQKINSSIKINAIVDDFNYLNAEKYTQSVDVLIDGLDNFDTRFLLNDIAVKNTIPYIYGGAVSTYGMTTTILPHYHKDNNNNNLDTRYDNNLATPCLRCIFHKAPPPGSSPTCDTVGVLASVVYIIASIQAAEAIKVLLHKYDCINRSLISINLWTNQWNNLKLDSAYKDNECPACQQNVFEYLDGTKSNLATTLCGNNAVQIHPPVNFNCDLNNIAKRIQNTSQITVTHYFLQTIINDGDNQYEITLFATGRAIIKGTTSPEKARVIYDRYIGS